MTSIIDNRDGNTLLNNLGEMSANGREISIATAFFSLDALLLMADSLGGYERIRVLFGDDASPRQRQRLMEMLRTRSDEDLLVQRETFPSLSPLKAVERLFASGRVEARCYTSRKFHAKAYLVERPQNSPPKLGILGSGNFTRPGLTQNLELNVKLYEEQTSQLHTWFEERWSEASADNVTDDVLAEIRRQIDLYNPYVIYLKALYTWGEQQQAEAGLHARTELQDALDPHQEQGYLRALKIIERDHGVMICDGVGLGKSFIALALMERFCLEKKNVLLIAPKNIITSSWNGYLARYLGRYRHPFGSFEEIAMTELGFNTDEGEDDPPALEAKREFVRRLFERADAVIVDESHNFRTTAARRYRNLLEIVQPTAAKRKAVVLLTATPINTAYQDMGNQLSLITQDGGNIGGFSTDQVKRSCRELDRSADGAETSPPEQLSLDIMDTPSELLNKVLQNVVIQRSRATCRELAASAGRALTFPMRNGPHVIEVEIGEQSPLYRELIATAHLRFEPGVAFVKELEAELKESDKKTKQAIFRAARRSRSFDGIKLAAFLTEQYRLPSAPSQAEARTYQGEVHLAKLVFANTLKQLESSPVAFQGILQSLGMGLVARLRYVFGEAVAAIIAEHETWIRTPLFGPSESAALEDVDTDEDVEEDGDTLDASGEESDAWLAQAVKARQLAKKLKGFDERSFDVERWRRDIVADLGYLREIHEATLRARKQPDPKMRCVLPRIAELAAGGNRILVFTQSQRTAEYLERELSSRLNDVRVARIDSRIEKTRPAILYAFCPGYNARATAPSVPTKIDILISTDVLSEGVNLQEAGAVVSWDIHWNPVRLIQRIGRVDRRLNPEIAPDKPAFDIVNVIPPKEIDDIIDLVGTIEDRALRISRTLGLDLSFFSSDDPAGSLKEFNAKYEGRITAADRALSNYARLAIEPPDAKTQAILDSIPPGALGVWSGAPRNGLFALYTMQPKPAAPPSDIERFAAVIGQPVLILEGDPPNIPPLTDAGEILAILAGTSSAPGAASGTPSDERQLKDRLTKLRNSVRSSFADIGLPATIAPKLVCWMELRK